MRDVVTRLERWLRANCPDRLDALAPGLTVLAIDMYAKDLGVTFPAGIKALHHWRSRTFPDRGPNPIIGPYDLLGLNAAVATQKRLTERDDAGEFPEPLWWQPAWLPLFGDGAGNYVCWDPRGEVIQFSDSARSAVAPSFDRYVSAYVDALESGVWRYDAAAGRMIDDDAFPEFLTTRFPGFPRDVPAPSPVAAPPPAPPPAAVGDAPRYAPSTTYALGDRVEHPQFGVGVVEIVEATKVTIAFTSGTKTLVHAHGGGAKLERPGRIDHTRTKNTKV